MISKKVITVLGALSAMYCLTANAQSINQKQVSVKKTNYRSRKLKQEIKNMQRWKESDDFCSLINHYTPLQRLKNYPFINASDIWLVSYRADEPVNKIMYDEVFASKADSSIEAQHKELGLHINDGILDSSTIIEKIILNETQTNELTNIIYNISYSKTAPIHMIIGSKCIPAYRNAIIVFDKQKKIFDYMEICFECEQSYSKSEKFTLGTYCTQKYIILKNFFKKSGVNYGTNKKSQD